MAWCSRTVSATSKRNSAVTLACRGSPTSKHRVVYSVQSVCDIMLEFMSSHFISSKVMGTSYEKILNGTCSFRGNLKTPTSD